MGVEQRLRWMWVNFTYMLGLAYVIFFIVYHLSLLAGHG